MDQDNSVTFTIKSENDDSQQGQDSTEENHEQESEPISGSEICDGNDNSCEGKTSVNNYDSETTTSNKKTFECDVCNMTFSNGANMRRHKMRHTGVKPYQCKICLKRFFRKDHLSEHFVCHTKALPYVCPICNQRFQGLSNIKNHFQHFHIKQNDTLKSCTLCNYTAGFMKNIRTHFIKSHGIDIDNPGVVINNLPIVATSLNSAEIGITSQTNNMLHQAIGFSDCDESVGNRLEDNTTPPMHFLTPHVELSLEDTSPSPSQSKLNKTFSNNIKKEINGDGSCNLSNTPQLVENNSYIPFNILQNEVGHNITPSVSLIPIKEEIDDDRSNGSNSSVRKSNNIKKLLNASTTSSLKTLLQDNLKKRTDSSVNRTTSKSTSIPISSSSRSPSIPVSSSSRSPSIPVSSTSNSSPSDVKNYWMKFLNPKNNTSLLKCFFCDILFPDTVLYFLHKKFHNESNPWQCNICGEQLNNVYEFNSHLLSKTHQLK